MIKESEIADKIRKNIETLFKSTGFVKVVDKQQDIGKRFPQVRPDLIIEVKTAGRKKYLLIFEIKSTGQPVGYGIFKHNIPWENVEDCYLDEALTIRYGGWGIRTGKVKGGFGRKDLMNTKTATILDEKG